MGQKIHPLGFRVGITKKHKAKWFANSDQYPQYILEDILLRKLLTSLIPPESLPRVFEDDKKMRIVEIQIERFIRNTLKIKIYAVNPDLSSLMLDQKTNRNYSSDENNNSSKNRKASIDANSKKELHISSESSQKFTKWKNIIRKKIFELKCYQFRNIIKKCNVLLEFSSISTKLDNDNFKQVNQSDLTNKLLKIKRLSEKRHQINLFLQRILTHRIVLKLPTELEILKVNLLYIYYTLQKYKLNLEIFELQHDLLRTNYQILKKFGILSKKWFITNNLRTIKRISKKFEKKLEELEKDQKIKKFELNFLKFPEILLRNSLQNALNQQNRQWVVNKCHHRLQNEYMSRFGGQLRKKRPIEFIKDLQTYINWHSETSLKVLKLNKENKKKSAYYASFRQLGQKFYLQRKKNLHKTQIEDLKKTQIKQQNIKLKKLVKRKIQNFMIENLLRKNVSNNAQFYKLNSIYQVQGFSDLSKKLTMMNSFPKISAIEIIEVKQPSEYAICLAYFITQKLEKRFSFRSVMKQAKRIAIQTPSVKGIKIQLSGRLNGAEIARTEWIREGRVPLQTLDADVDYSYKTAQTLYGIIGVKVWVFRKKTQY
uniref:Small ribosomal subunit protein uS3c n=1 Tax=Oedocladium carolinianum TaxID=55992 RepID=A0A1D8GX93_9CHLO|nr:ribosomal protein S3 [Oedocladium carolinianum]AOT84333.1 ribosomal protein S3 [Oedocladium carolinianum]